MDHAAADVAWWRGDDLAICRRARASSGGRTRPAAVRQSPSRPRLDPSPSSPKRRKYPVHGFGRHVMTSAVRLTAVPARRASLQRSAPTRRPPPGNPHRTERRTPRDVATAAAEPAARIARRSTYGPQDEKPDYAAIDSVPLNRAVMGLFRRKMAAAVGEDSELPGYDGIVDLTWKLNTKFPSPKDTQTATVGILLSLMPSWLPGLFKVMFAEPLPGFSNAMNAYVTAATCQWLMGVCKVNDVELPSGEVRKNWGMKVERCRYLEESGCAAVCVNSCKVPTQSFFKDAMGVDLEMTPNYEDFSCQFNFGSVPKPQEEDKAFSTPCFGQCPRKAFSSLEVDTSQDVCHNIGSR